MPAAKKTEEAAHDQTPRDDETVTDATTAEQADATGAETDRAETDAQSAQRDDRPVWDIATHGQPTPGTENLYRVINSSARR